MTETPDENGTARGDDGTTLPAEESGRETVSGDLATTKEPGIARMDDTPEGHPGGADRG